MKLKSMQLVGFKSFAEKTTIDFQNGLTAIVGPNGSGKSNVIEAIRWVLGEQSAKHLRSTKMADVIFSGSKSHRALNRAEVTLTFDNSDHYLNTDYTEVAVTRKLFRNGDSYYYLNHKECRLKDINNLLMDTGIGLGSFSIISQGNVEAIFNSKPEERRNIIETTAGIFKYRQRKQVADQRLVETNDNLSRVNDIIFELESQVTTLAKQSQAATKYQTLSQTLAQKHQKHLACDANRLLKEYSTDEAQLQASQRQASELTSQIEGLREQKRTTQQQIDGLTSQQDQFQAKLLKNSNQIEKDRAQIQLDTQQSTFKTEQLSAAKENLANLMQAYSKLEDQIMTVEAKQNEQQATINDLQSASQAPEVAELTATDAEYAKQLDELRAQYLDLLQRASAAKNRLTYADKDNAQFDRQKQMIDQRISVADAAIQDLQHQKQALAAQLAAKQTELTAQTNRFADVDHQLQTLQATVNQSQTQWYAEMKSAQQLRAKLNGLVEYQNQHGGYFQGSRNLLNHRTELNGIIGAVAEFINVDEPYIKAIETALGNRIQQIMVSDNQSARAAVQFMTSRRLGRVTLLPINSLNQHVIPSATINQIQSIDGYVAVASQLVQLPSQYQSVRKALLGNVLIANNLRAATQISAAIGRRYRVVTLDGQVVNAGGSITGGATQKQFNGMLTQKEQANELKRSVAKANQKVLTLEQQVKAAQAELKQLQADDQKYGQTKLELQQSVQTLAGKLKQVQSSIDGHQRDVAAQRINLRTLTDNLKLNQDDDLKAQLASLNAQIERNQAQVKVVNQQITDLNARKQRVQSSQQSNREQLLLAQSELEHIDQRMQELKQRLADNQAQQIKLNQLIKTLTDQINGQLTNADLNTKISVLKRSVADLNQQIAAGQTELKRLKQLIQPIDAQIDQAQDALLSAQTSSEKLQRAMQSATDQLQAIKTTAIQKYGLRFKQLVQLPVTEDVKTLSQQMTTLKSQINALGPVNVNSITEFQAVNERYQFLKQQADDLIQSKQQLESTMSKMDATVKKRFKDTFDQLQQAFATTFKEIFGGGDAKLKLTDPVHLLTTGIEIMAQPPGKRFRSMTLLSGGERSLTAIALLFAILRLRPVPFTILDEAESALDPANVDRFARYIQKLKNQTQFIVITHRKETMVYADNLYGVTMQDSGISKVLTVDLKRAQTTKG
ncbi:chromosome segregation protein SMC [Nicoliella spurrieriana]|uniref:Chromosome partition protein Smc n=1 Tax=Nicoliella spurrieriana TaxID=2925830 RepID=A0A976RRR7_9LACO|nr:chromosome segregation protein SMC [Nicoliella spurrieriana]UQS86632.1 chromosome segregation protein SMC [Nicoliella spurrieriana]